MDISQAEQTGVASRPIADYAAYEQHFSQLMGRAA